MTAIALTYAEGHPRHGEILTWQRKPWNTPGEYQNKIFANCLFDCQDDMQPKSIKTLGLISSKTFDTWNGPVTCVRVYQDCVIDLEPIEEDQI